MVQECARTVDDYQLCLGPRDEHGSDMACWISAFGARNIVGVSVLRLILIQSGTAIGAIYAYVVSPNS